MRSPCSVSMAQTLLLLLQLSGHLLSAGHRPTIARKVVCRRDSLCCTPRVRRSRKLAETCRDAKAPIKTQPLPVRQVHRTASSKDAAPRRVRRRRSSAADTADSAAAAAPTRAAATPTAIARRHRSRRRRRRAAAASARGEHGPPARRAPKATDTGEPCRTYSAAASAMPTTLRRRAGERLREHWRNHR